MPLSIYIIFVTLFSRLKLLHKPGFGCLYTEIWCLNMLFCKENGTRLSVSYVFSQFDTLLLTNELSAYKNTFFCLISLNYIHSSSCSAYIDHDILNSNKNNINFSIFAGTFSCSNIINGKKCKRRKTKANRQIDMMLKNRGLFFILYKYIVDHWMSDEDI